MTKIREALGEGSERKHFCIPLPCFAIEAKVYPETSDEESLLGRLRSSQSALYHR